MYNTLVFLLRGVVLCLFIVTIACNSNEYAPKPKSYFRIDLPQPKYIPLDNTSFQLPYSFNYSKYAEVEKYKGAQKNSSNWININYKNQQCKFYITHSTINNNVVELCNEARSLVYKHTIKADAIDEEVIDDPENKKYGVLYHIRGNAASPMQFYITDSVKNFMRVSMYFDTKPNADSLKPVTTYLKKDMYAFIYSLKWN
jgi:gliding motility-associated lipoprotein GldD